MKTTELPDGSKLYLYHIITGNGPKYKIHWVKDIISLDKWFYKRHYKAQEKMEELYEECMIRLLSGIY